MLSFAERMLDSFFQRGVSNLGTSWLVFTTPALLLLGAAFRTLRRREWMAASIFLLVLAGFSIRHAARIPGAPFDPAKLPSELYISQPDLASLDRPSPAAAFGRKVLRLHTPSEMTWILTGRERELSFDYGYIPEAYLEGRPEGADFVLEISHGTSIRRIFQRTLAPLARLSDRQPQFSRIVLPPFQTGDRLVLRLSPRVQGNHARNWLYVGNLKFRHSSHFLSSQFPSFETVPWETDAPTSSLYQKDGHATFLQLDAPSRLTFLLKGTERRLTFSYGILPAAHQNGGNTDGAGFRVELQGAAGINRVLFERLLQPVAVPPDRGRQYLNLTLPATPRGTRLVIVIDPGPAKNDAWDWTYVNRLSLE